MGNTAGVKDDTKRSIHSKEKERQAKRKEKKFKTARNAEKKS